MPGYVIDTFLARYETAVYSLCALDDADTLLEEGAISHSRSSEPQVRKSTLHPGEIKLGGFLQICGDVIRLIT